VKNLRFRVAGTAGAIVLLCAVQALAQRSPSLPSARHLELKKLGPAKTPELLDLRLDVLSYPRMCGSTSTQPLAALIACRNFGMDYEWVGREQRLPPWAFRPRVEPDFQLLEFTLQAKWQTAKEERLAQIINGLLAANTSTHDAYVQLIEGKSDIGLIARLPAQSELKVAATKRVALEVMPCALDAFVFLVNTENPVRSLTTAQIRGIYSGRITDWNSVGGRPAKIVAYQREEESGSQQLMRTLVMKDVPLATPKEPHARAPQLIAGLMGGVYLELSSNEDGLGYSVHYYERYMARSPKTRVIAVEGVEPSYETIRDRRYPHTCNVFVVIRKDLDARAPARRLRDWLRSAEGQAVVRESGYVPNTAVER
jgi:phosphate transport system substrate-binding protein